MFSQEGTLHISALEPESPAKPATYVVTFTPSHRGGGALKNLICYGEDKLANVLADMGVSSNEKEQAIQSVKKSRTASIDPIVLSEEQLQRYRLGEIGVGDTIREFLGSLSSNTSSTSS